MENGLFSNLMVYYIEREVFRQLDSDAIAKRFKATEIKEKHLPKSGPSLDII